jgi:hypothetical protein
MTLTYSNNSVVATTLTDDTGAYLFAELEPNDYIVGEVNLPEYPGDISDQDTDSAGEATDPFDSNTAIDNKIGVRLYPGESDVGNDFVDSDEGEIRGNVRASDGTLLKDVLLELKSEDGTTVLMTTRTIGTGEYVFLNVDPGDYNVVETNPGSYPVNILDEDRIPDTMADPTDSDTTVDNTIGVRLHTGEIDAGNDFIDGKFGSVSGVVSDDNGAPLAGATIELKWPNGTVLGTITTGGNGVYKFDNVVPGDYIVEETNPTGYDTDVSDQDEV